MRGVGEGASGGEKGRRQREGWGLAETQKTPARGWSRLGRPLRVTPPGAPFVQGPQVLEGWRVIFGPGLDGRDVRVFPGLPSWAEPSPRDSSESFLLCSEEGGRGGEPVSQTKRREGVSGPPFPRHNGVPLDDRCCLTSLTLCAEMALLTDRPRAERSEARRARVTGRPPLTREGTVSFSPTLHHPTLR